VFLEPPHDGILCFGGEDWWYHNQAHFDMQIMRRMARHVPVLYVNSVGFRMPALKEGAQFFYRIARKVRSAARPVTSPFPGFHVASPFSVPLWHRPSIAKVNIFSLSAQIAIACRSVRIRNPLVWVACPTAFQVVQRFRSGSYLVYQRTDKFEEYSDQTRKYIVSAHQWLLRHADLILYASTALYEEERRPNLPGLLIKHAVDLERFDISRARRAPTPPDINSINRPIAGFFGEVSGDTVDMQFVAAVARALPEVSFVFVGRLVADPAPMRGLPNVHFVGMKPYEKVAQYGARFDVAIMPWKRSRWIHYCSPIKLKEYLALGLPVVSTEFPEALLYQDVIFVAHSSDQFAQGIRDALEGRGIGNSEKRRRKVAGDSWDAATARVLEAIRELGNRDGHSG
jgi:glycosyltransferase involved in cell wall biosynthesis